MRPPGKVLAFSQEPSLTSASTTAKRRDAERVARRLREAGHQALFCGGAVRDLLMGREPNDFDVATSAPPEVGRKLFPEAVLVGAQFGVLIVPRPSGPVELATFRADGLYVDGRRPETVTYSDAPTDASRRDFTVNGLFQDPDSGEVIDYVDGRADMRARLVRAIGDAWARFEEDHLRILRAVRFAVQLNFAIAPDTRAAVVDMADAVETVSGERIRVELLKILRHGRGEGLRLLRDTGLLQVVLPEIERMQDVPQPPQFHPEGDVFVHTCLVLDGLTLPSLDTDGDVAPEARKAIEDASDDLVMSCLLHDVAKPTTYSRDSDGRIRFHGHDADGVRMSESILERYRFPHRAKERVGALIGNHMKIAAVPKMRTAKMRRFLGQEDIELHLALHAADCGASHGGSEILTYCRARLNEFADAPVIPPPLVTGKDLLALGYKPGPRMGRILRWVQDEQLEGRLTEVQDAVRRVQEEFPPDEASNEPRP